MRNTGVGQPSRKVKIIIIIPPTLRRRRRRLIVITIGLYASSQIVLSVIFHATYVAVCIQLTHLSCDDCENTSTLSYHHHHAGSTNYLSVSVSVCVCVCVRHTCITATRPLSSCTHALYKSQWQIFKNRKWLGVIIFRVMKMMLSYDITICL